MIIGNINHLDLIPYLPTKITQVIKYIKDNVNANTPIGRYDVEGDNLFFMLSESPTRDIQDAYPEYHKKYLDVQIVLSGPEGIAISTLPPYTKVIEDDILNNDIAFVETPNEETLLTLHQHDFIVFFPGELHKPLCAINNKRSTVRKVVVKIAVSAL